MRIDVLPMEIKPFNGVRRKSYRDPGMRGIIFIEEAK